MGLSGFRCARPRIATMQWPEILSMAGLFFFRRVWRNAHIINDIDGLAVGQVGRVDEAMVVEESGHHCFLDTVDAFWGGPGSLGNNSFDCCLLSTVVESTRASWKVLPSSNMERKSFFAHLSPSGSILWASESKRVTLLAVGLECPKSLRMILRRASHFDPVSASVSGTVTRSLEWMTFYAVSMLGLTLMLGLLNLLSKQSSSPSWGQQVNKDSINLASLSCLRCQRCHWAGRCPQRGTCTSR